MLHTRNTLPEKHRIIVVEALQRRLSETIDIMQQAKHAHWNVKGEGFFSLHLLFDQIHKDLLESMDTIAERIVQLGGVAEGTCSLVVKRTKLPEYPNAITDGKDHLYFFANSLAQLSLAIHEDLVKILTDSDPISADIMTGIGRTLEKDLWFVESHFSEEEKRKIKDVA